MEAIVDYEKLVRNKFRTLIRAVESRGGDKDDIALIRKAYKIASDAHKDVKRKSGEPYITHPLDVALIVAKEIGLGPQSIAAALLHDVVEDSDYTKEQLAHLFGPAIAYMVEGLTKIQGIFDTQSSSMQVENFRKLLLSISDDVRVILIKMADRLHNMRTMDGMPYHKQLKIASETLYIFAPLAHRMGLYHIKSEYEDLGLKYTEPDIYTELAQKLQDAEEDDAIYLERFSQNIESLLESEGLNYSIKRRNKGIFSIRRKMLNQGVSFEEVYDKYAIRVILDSHPKREKSDLWRVYSIITGVFRPNPRRLRDWVTSPKANGYESLHITVMGPEGHWVEVQLRSHRMDEGAEKGYAAHWRYKEDNSGNTALDEWVNKIRDAIENQGDSAVEFVDQFKLQLFSEEVFAFTPQGKMLTLPKHATVIDFAFEIHTGIGMTTLGAKVNGKLVPLSYEIQSGDQVLILSSENQKPQTEWLEWVVTPKAKARIRQFLRDQHRDEQDRGKKLLSRLLLKAKSELNQSTTQKMLNFFSLKNPKELFERFGSGQYGASQFRSFVQEEAGGFYQYLRKRFKPKTIALKDLRVLSSHIVFGPDQVLLEHRLATCCRPIQGDQIFGFVDKDGIDVHRTDCRQAIHLQGRFAEKVLIARWATGESQQFNATLRFSGIDSAGLIMKVTSLITKDLNVDIRALHIDGNEGIFTGTISVKVSDRGQLVELAHQLKSIKGIDRVEREINKVL
jgi:GTP diphosphokinase / guanosine-3',5'-bis(diphosphate) 3'-diphosphatase